MQNYRDGLVIVEHLVTVDAGNASWQHDLAVTDSLIADALRAQGQPADALKSYRNSLAVLERLAKLDPARCGLASRSHGDLSDKLVTFSPHCKTRRTR